MYFCELFLFYKQFTALLWAGDCESFISVEYTQSVSWPKRVKSILRLVLVTMINFGLCKCDTVYDSIEEFNLEQEVMLVVCYIVVYGFVFWL